MSGPASPQHGVRLYKRWKTKCKYCSGIIKNSGLVIVAVTILFAGT